MSGRASVRLPHTQIAGIKVGEEFPAFQRPILPEVLWSIKLYAPSTGSEDKVQHVVISVVNDSNDTGAIRYHRLAEKAADNLHEGFASQ